MWLNITVIIIILLIVTLSGAGLIFVRNTTTDLNKNITKLENTINQGQWETASIIYDKINKTWNTATNIFPLILDHAEFHDLEITLARIESHIKQKKKKEIMPEIKIALKLLDNIKQQQKMSLQNIF